MWGAAGETSARQMRSRRTPRGEYGSGTLPPPRSCRLRRLRPVSIDLRLDVCDSLGVACRLKEMAVPSLALQVVFDRAASMGDIGVRHHPVHRFLEGKEARLDRQVGVFRGQCGVVEPPGRTRRLRNEQFGPTPGLRFQELITRLLQYLKTSKISLFVSGRGNTSPLPWLGRPQARLTHALASRAAGLNMQTRPEGVP